MNHSISGVYCILNLYSHCSVNIQFGTLKPGGIVTSDLSHDFGKFVSPIRSDSLVVKVRWKLSSVWLINIMAKNRNVGIAMSKTTHFWWFIPPMNMAITGMIYHCYTNIILVSLRRLFSRAQNRRPKPPRMARRCTPAAGRIPKDLQMCMAKQWIPICVYLYHSMCL